jgi:hypothetical protein
VVIFKKLKEKEIITMEEQLKQIIYENQKTDYFISSFGRLYNQKTKNWYKGRISENGYLDYILRINGKEKNFRAHRLVAEYFIPKNNTNANIVNHKDGNKLNNNVENLEWTTNQENTIHAIKTGLRKKETNTILYYTEDLSGEIWKSLLNTTYSVSNLGRVRNDTTNRILTGKRDTGYVRYELRIEGKRKTYLGHRLVYKVFNPSFDLNDRTLIINHIDGDKQNNCLSNLELITQSENIKHSYYISKTNSKIKKVGQYDKNMNLIKIYNSANEASRETNIRQGLISSACLRCGTSHDFNWRYLD